MTPSCVRRPSERSSTAGAIRGDCPAPRSRPSRYLWPHHQWRQLSRRHESCHRLGSKGSGDRMSSSVSAVAGRSAQTNAEGCPIDDFVRACQPVLSAATDWGSIAHALPRTKDQGPCRDSASMRHLKAACRRRSRKAQARLRPGQWLNAWTPLHADVRGCPIRPRGDGASTPLKGSLEERRLAVTMIVDRAGVLT
jgi:hypothetical protein